MKRTSKVSLIAALSLVLSLFTSCITGFAAMPEVIRVDEYADVGADHWAYQWVQYMTKEGYIHGYPTDENDGRQVYKPGQNITRAEFVTILYFMLDPTGDMTQTFSDVSVDDWYYEYISKAVANGYMSGYGDGTAKPNAFITREEATSVVYRAFDIAKYDEVTNFVDAADISDWAYEAIMSLAQLGVVVGDTSDGDTASAIRPQVNILRAEVASLLANAEKFHPTQVKIDVDTNIEISDNGANAVFALKPYNTSDELSVAFDIEGDVTYTVSYTKGGQTYNVTPEEFAAVVFTADELSKANITLNFPGAKDGDVIKGKISVSDANAEGDNKVVGSKDFELKIGTKTSPEPSTSPSPTVEPIHGGGGSSSVTKYTVTAIVNPGDNQTTATISVERGKTINIALLPKPDAENTYAWYSDAECTTPYDFTKPVTGNVTIYAKDGEVVVRDRVVESLKGYQDMKDKKTEATTNVLSADEVDSTLTDAYADGKWWTNDMISVIVNNDRNKLSDGSYDAMETASKPLAPVYNDVARYVVDNSTLFNAGATGVITSANKFDYVQYFRAMVKTIETSATAAVEAYNTELANGGTRETAMTKFNAAAVAAVAASLTEDGLADNDEIKTLALGYVAALIEKAGGMDAIDAALSVDGVNQPATVDQLATMLNNALLYPKN